MLTLTQYKEIKTVRDLSPFTVNMNITSYIKGVRFRLSQYYGVPEELITDEQIYKFLIHSEKCIKK